MKIIISFEINKYKFSENNECFVLFTFQSLRLNINLIWNLYDSLFAFEQHWHKFWKSRYNLSMHFEYCPWLFENYLWTFVNMNFYQTCIKYKISSWIKQKYSLLVRCFSCGVDNAQTWINTMFFLWSFTILCVFVGNSMNSFHFYCH